MRDSKYRVQRQTECLRNKPRECACVSLRKRMWDRESVREKEKERERERERDAVVSRRFSEERGRLSLVTEVGELIVTGGVRERR